MKKGICLVIGFLFVFSCKSTIKKRHIPEKKFVVKYPSDVLPFMNQWKILLGDGTRSEDLTHYKKDNFFYVKT